MDVKRPTEKKKRDYNFQMLKTTIHFINLGGDEFCVRINVWVVAWDSVFLFFYSESDKFQFATMHEYFNLKLDAAQYLVIITCFVIIYNKNISYFTT